MQVIAYDQLLRQVAQLLGEDASKFDAQRWREVRDALNHALERWWTFAWWPGLMRVEQRPLRTPYDATVTYEAGAEVWHAPSAAYYRAMRETTGTSPASYDGAEWDVTVGYWALCATGYELEDYDAATAYVAGDQVFYPQTGQIYQAHTAVTGHAPTDTDYWGELAPFVASLPRTMAGYNTIGHVRGMYAQDPRQNGAVPKVDFVETHDVWVVQQTGVPLPWVEYRLRCPVLEGEIFSASASYTPAVTDVGVEDTVPIINDSRLFREFSTVADLIAADSDTFRFAHVFNYAGTDGVNSTWVKTAEPGLVDNGGDIRQLADGAFVRRTYTDP